MCVLITGTMQVVSLLVSLLLIIFLSTLAKAFHRLWWNPRRVERMMAAQGIKGPPYRFLHGSTKEALKMRMDAKDKPLNNLSHDTLPKLEPQIHNWLNKYGKNYISWYGPQAHLIITEPELIKEVLNNKEKTYPKPKLEIYAEKLLGDSIVTTNDAEKWAKHRKLANYAFNGESLKNMVPEMVKSVHMMLTRWESQEGKEIEVSEEFKSLTSEVISRTAFGSSYIEGQRIFKMLTRLGVLLTRNIMQISIPGVSKFWKNSDEIEAERLEKGIQDAIMEIIRKREKYLKVGDANELGDDFLGQLVKAYKSKRITLQNLVDECKTFYIAGQETTYTLLTWTILFLTTHPDWQEEARKEVFEVFGAKDPDNDGLTKLRKIGMVLNETLRLYPPVLVLTRNVDKQIRLGKLVLPANIQIHVPVIKLHHDPEIWGKDALLFKPERFSEGVAKATNNNAAVFIPFGLGPRICAGTNFAINEAKIALSMILQRYTFKLSPTYIHCPTQLLTTRPQHGLPVMFEVL